MVFFFDFSCFHVAKGREQIDEDAAVFFGEQFYFLIANNDGVVIFRAFSAERRHRTPNDDRVRQVFF